jgi:hypothetical protein
MGRAGRSAGDSVVKTLEHTTEIDAPAETVWNTITDLGAYGEWNPFLVDVAGSLDAGSRLAIQMRPGKRSMTFRPTVLEVLPGRTLRWLGRFLVPGIFDGAHVLTVEPLDGQRSRFTQREHFSGILVPLMGGLIRDTDAGFAAMNEALKRRAEADVRR